jgi:glycosyltransferase involved in cell wall biosynthesis
MVGTVEPRKNHIFVLNTLAMLRAEGKQVPRLVVVGRRGWKNKEAKRQLREAVRAGWVEWHDQGIPDDGLADLYARAHCVIQASLDEGFGLPVAEAAAMGKPVVLSDIPVFREIVRDNGYFFRVGDGESFSEALASACRPDAKPTSTKAVSWQESADIFWQRCLELREAEIARAAT